MCVRGWVFSCVPVFQSQLELLMMEGEEVEGGRAHFSLDSIIQQEREAGKKATRRRKRKEKQVCRVV